MIKNIEKASEMCPSLKEWLNKNNTKHNTPISCHNIYHIQRKDINGNVIEEAFASNVLTNNGMNRLFCDDRINTYERILIGSGTTQPQVTDNNLENVLAVTTAITSNVFKCYPLTYDSETGFISQYCRKIKAEFQYNIDGITDPFNITEIGYSNSNYSNSYNLCSRALIKTADNKNYITKNPNEMLTIYLYFSSSVHESLITNAWNNGKYVMIGNIAGWLYPWSYISSGHLYTALKTLYNNVFNGNNSSIVNSEALYPFQYNKINESTNILQSKIHTVPSYTLTDKSTPIHGTMLSDDKTYWYSDIMMYIPEKLSTDEEIVTYNAYTSSQYDDSLIYNFGYHTKYRSSDYDRYGFRYHLPVYDFNIESLSMYNHLTKEWDIEENFTNPYDIDYSEMYSFGAGNAHCLMYDPSGDPKNCYVYINNKAKQKSINGKVKAPITSFDMNGAIIYAADKYWDVNDWELISNIKAVDESLQDKKYYIFIEAYTIKAYDDYYNYLTSWKRTYYETHRIIPDEAPYNIVPSLKLPTISIKQYSQGMSNEDNGWFVIYDYLIYPDTTEGAKYYKLKASGDVSIDVNYGWEWGDRIIVRATGGNGNNDTPANKVYQQRYFRMYYTNNPNQLTEPNYVDIELDWSSPCSVSSLENCYSYSNHGWLIIWRKRSESPETIILNVYGDEDNETTQYTLPVENAWWIHALNCTDYLVYCEYNQKQFHLFNMETKEDSVIFEIDDDYTIEGIGGWKDSIYVHVSRSGIYSTFYYSIKNKILSEIQTGVIEGFKINPVNNNIYNVSNEEVYVLTTGTVTYGNYHIHKFISSDDPTVFNDLADDSSIASDDAIDIRNVQLKYINDGKQLLMSFMENDTNKSYSSYPGFSVVDIGKMIDDKKGMTTVTYARCGSYNASYIKYGSLVFWKNGVVVMRRFETDELWWYPIEYFLPHKMVGTTRTIQAYNNPKMLSGRTFSMSISNDTSKQSL